MHANRKSGCELRFKVVSITSLLKVDDFDCMIDVAKLAQLRVVENLARLVRMIVLAISCDTP